MQSNDAVVGVLKRKQGKKIELEKRNKNRIQKEKFINSLRLGAFGRWKKFTYVKKGILTTQNKQNKQNKQNNKTTTQQHNTT